MLAAVVVEELVMEDDEGSDGENEELGAELDDELGAGLDDWVPEWAKVQVGDEVLVDDDVLVLELELVLVVRVEVLASKSLS